MAHGVVAGEGDVRWSSLTVDWSERDMGRQMKGDSRCFIAREQASSVVQWAGMYIRRNGR